MKQTFPFRKPFKTVIFKIYNHLNLTKLALNY